MSGLVSIIVPVYRAKPYIAETIAMVVRQKYTEWELLLIEDGSPDGSAQAVRDKLRDHKWNRLSADRRDVRGVGEEQAQSVQAQGIHSVEEYTDDKDRRIVLICKEKNEGAAAARATPGWPWPEGGILRFWTQMTYGFRRNWRKNCFLCGSSRLDSCSRHMSSVTNRRSLPAKWYMFPHG